MAPFSAIVETCLCVQDLARAKDFYADPFGYAVIRSDERFCAFDIGGKQVFLLFVRGSDPEGTVLPFGTILPHGTAGVSHIGFRVPAESLAADDSQVRELQFRPKMTPGLKGRIPINDIARDGSAVLRQERNEIDCLDDFGLLERLRL